jgi:hypothetical protein
MKKLYFNHDINAANDDKILEIRAAFGWEGYGLFWALLETMFNNGGKIKKANFRGLALNLGIANEMLLHYMSIAIELQLFVEDNLFVWSNRLKNQIDGIEALSSTRKDAAYKRWNNNLQPECNCNANALQKECNCNADNIILNNIIQNNNILCDVDSEGSKNDAAAKKGTEKSPFGETGTVFLKPAEHEKLIKLYGKTILDIKIAGLEDNLAQGKSKKYKDHYLTLNNWCKEYSIKNPKLLPERESKEEKITDEIFLSVPDPNNRVGEILESLQNQTIKQEPKAWKQKSL